MVLGHRVEFLGLIIGQVGRIDRKGKETRVLGS
jgi:hypothetical protein